jgi:hypothetical protein
MSPAPYNDDSEGYAQPAIGKGKGKAKSPDVTERTPLLSSTVTTTTAGTHAIDLQPSPAILRSRQRLFRKLLYVFSIALATCIIIFIFLLLIVYSYSSRVSNISTEDILERGLTIKGPDRLDVLNTTDSEGIWVQAEGRVGIDVGALIGVKSSKEDPIWKSWWKAMGRFGVEQLGGVSLDLSTIQVTPWKDRSTVLGIFHTLPIPLVLTADPPADLSWLSPVSLTVLISPTKNASTLVDFARECWRSGMVNVATSVASVSVRGGGLFDNSWRSMLRLVRQDIKSLIRLKSMSFSSCDCLLVIERI